MHKLKTFVVESVSPKDFYCRRWEGHVVEEIVRLLNGKASYKIVLSQTLLRRAIKSAAKNGYDILHISCHGDEEGIRLTNNKDMSWEELAECFQSVRKMPSALILSSCVGGDWGLARAFAKRKRRPDVVFGAEGQKGKEITFHGACISWPVLYTELAAGGMTSGSFQKAVTKMNLITPHQFVYRRWTGEKYKRYPTKQ